VGIVIGVSAAGVLNPLFIAAYPVWGVIIIAVGVLSGCARPTEYAESPPGPSLAV
jgi:hypothetical protein